MRGRFAIYQPRRGHRSGTDALLLAATVPADAAGHLVDLGAGSGAVAFAALSRAPDLTATLVERDEENCERCERALRLPQNAHLRDRARIVCADVEHVGRELGHGVADYVVANPPFNPSGMQVSNDPMRTNAHAGSEALLRSWHEVARKLLRPGGLAAFICRAQWWGAAFPAGDMGDVRLLPVHAREDASAARIVVTARKARRTPARILPPLVLHGANGAFTPRATGIAEGRAGLFDAGD